MQLRWRKDATPMSILDFDIETVAAGYDDPQFVPSKITCVAWSWVGDDTVQSRISTSEGLFSKPELRREMLGPLLAAIECADMVTGHNLLRFDLPCLAAECMRLDLQPVGRKLVQDTMRLARSKGFKKGQDNLTELLDVPIKKLSLSWQGWQHAYEEEDWKTVRERAESDVLAHKQLRLKLIERGLLKEPVYWRP